MVWNKKNSAFNDIKESNSSINVKKAAELSIKEMKLLIFSLVILCLGFSTSSKIISKNESKSNTHMLTLYVEDNDYFEVQSDNDTFAFYTLKDDKLESEYVYNVYSLDDSVKI